MRSCHVKQFDKQKCLAHVLIITNTLILNNRDVRWSGFNFPYVALWHVTYTWLGTRRRPLSAEKHTIFVLLVSCARCLNKHEALTTDGSCHGDRVCYEKRRNCRHFVETRTLVKKQQQLDTRQKVCSGEEGDVLRETLARKIVTIKIENQMYFWYRMKQNEFILQPETTGPIFTCRCERRPT